jgi:serine/threonine protein kinase
MIANQAILERGIKTAEIIAAVQKRLIGPFYKGYLFSLEIPGCLDLVTYFNGIRDRIPQQRYRAKADIFEAVANAFTVMHRSGIYHGDLHLKNVLIRPANTTVPPEVYLIDFDKVILKSGLSPQEKISNLMRFNRSIEKYRFCGGGITRTDQWKLCRAYLKENGDVKPLFLKAMKRYRLMLKLRRIIWGFRRRGISIGSHGSP